MQVTFLSVNLFGEPIEAPKEPERREGIPLSARGMMLDRIDEAVQSGRLVWADNDAYADLMNVLFPEDFPAVDPPLIGRMATLVRSGARGVMVGREAA